MDNFDINAFLTIESIGVFQTQVMLVIIITQLFKEINEFFRPYLKIIPVCVALSIQILVSYGISTTEPVLIKFILSLANSCLVAFTAMKSVDILKGSLNK
jgi:uncharacterized membrane protein